MRIRPVILPMLVAAALAALPMSATGQSSVDFGTASTPAVHSSSALPDFLYTPPTEAEKIRNHSFDIVGPYPVAVGLIEAGIDEDRDSPPEWKQGAVAYSKRFGSALGTGAVSTTARYGLSEVFREDSLYYRCSCTGFFPRFTHAVVSTLTARRGDDGHRVFSVPGLIAPYAGSLTAVYGWFPSRYGAKDALRMGNYTMLGYVGGNIGLEFLYSGPHSLLSRMHLNSRHDATNTQ